MFVALGRSLRDFRALLLTKCKHAPTTFQENSHRGPTRGYRYCHRWHNLPTKHFGATCTMRLSTWLAYLRPAPNRNSRLLPWKSRAGYLRGHFAVPFAPKVSTSVGNASSGLSCRNLVVGFTSQSHYKYTTRDQNYLPFSGMTL